MNTEMIIKKLPVSMLKPAKYNPRVDLQPGEEKEVTITLNSPFGSETFTIVPPPENVQLPEVTPEQRAANDKRFAYEDSLRHAYEDYACFAAEQALAYVRAELVDEGGLTVPDAEVKLSAEATGAARLLGFGSANPVTDENYTKGELTSYRGAALAVLRSGYRAGVAALRVIAEGIGEARIELKVEG